MVSSHFVSCPTAPFHFEISALSAELSRPSSSIGPSHFNVVIALLNAAHFATHLHFPTHCALLSQRSGSVLPFTQAHAVLHMLVRVDGSHDSSVPQAAMAAGEARSSVPMEARSGSEMSLSATGAARDI